MTSTRNPFKILVKEFSEDQNRNKSILKKFLDMIHDSIVKAFFEDKSSKKFWVMMEKAYSKVLKTPLTLSTVFPLVPIYLSL